MGNIYDSLNLTCRTGRLSATSISMRQHRRPSSESAARMLLRSWDAPTARAFVPSRLAYRFGWRKGSRQRYRGACGTLGRASAARVAKLSQQQKAMLVGTRRRNSSLPGG